MSGLFVPPLTAQRLLEERAQREAELRKAMVGEERFEWKKQFDAELDRLVPGMRLLFCPDPAPLDAVAAGAFPGRWNLVWPGYHGGPLNVKPLEVNGEFVEPGSWVFDMLAREDMWSERATRERNRISREAREAKDRRLERERADRDQDVLERYLAVSRTQVSMNRDSAWSQNAAGKRGALT
jgi:hypothetical protein